MPLGSLIVAVVAALYVGICTILRFAYRAGIRDTRDALLMKWEEVDGDEQNM